MGKAAKNIKDEEKVDQKLEEDREDEEDVYGIVGWIEDALTGGISSCHQICI